MFLDDQKSEYENNSRFRFLPKWEFLWFFKRLFKAGVIDTDEITLYKRMENVYQTNLMTTQIAQFVFVPSLTQ